MFIFVARVMQEVVQLVDSSGLSSQADYDLISYISPEGFISFFLTRRLSQSSVNFGSNMGQDKINSNSKYQKEIERSFAVIYHNLKRIQDTEHAPLTRRYNQPETSSSAVSQQRRRRLGKDKTNSTVAQGSKSTRRVSFSV